MPLLNGCRKRLPLVTLKFTKGIYQIFLTISIRQVPMTFGKSLSLILYFIVKQPISGPKINTTSGAHENDSIFGFARVVYSGLVNSSDMG